ncbi:hypothetical protein SeMB42_g02183 [Synchytrium endobioticum]|uniref:Glutamate decarboxylase n=1 Tax=Synchytrium endobioticum TaxID=286115 RepID=A0A507DH52_9FUNG|nr:hypothetical protein SeLEV6574_g02842 [Synchytrium endobioticum]TPX50645.1 hypothetical protein SeMB42_g02183 [Synchytrium endobioticum]
MTDDIRSSPSLFLPHYELPVEPSGIPTTHDSVPWLSLDEEFPLDSNTFDIHHTRIPREPSDPSSPDTETNCTDTGSIHSASTLVANGGTQALVTGDLSPDSVIRYFVSTKDSESELDDYINSLIEVFLHKKSKIYLRHQNNHLTTVFNTTVMSEEPGKLDSYINNVRTDLIETSTRTSSPKMIGHVTTSLPFFQRPLAKLITALHQSTVRVETATSLTPLERSSIAMLHRQFYDFNSAFYNQHSFNPDSVLGVLCSSRTICNITAMWAARNAAFPPKEGFNGIETQGLATALEVYGYKGAAIVGSRIMHHSMKKAVDLMGIGENGFKVIDIDAGFHVNVDDVKKTVIQLRNRNILVIAIVGIAGTTEAGSIDNLNALADIASEHGIHFHVDSAWGGPMVFSTDHRPKLIGIERADSLTVNGHTQLYTPTGLGVLLLKSPTLAHRIKRTANHVIRNGSYDQGRFTLEESRPANVIHLHASLNLLGSDGLGALMTRSCALTRQLYSRLLYHPAACFAPVHQPDSNILLYRYIPAPLRSRVRHLMANIVDSSSKLSHSVSTASLFDTSDDQELNALEEEWIDEATTRLHEMQAKEGVSEFVSRTRVIWRGRETVVLRVVLANPLSTWDDLNGCTNEQVWLGERVERDIELEHKYPHAGYPSGWQYDSLGC